MIFLVKKHKVLHAVEESIVPWGVDIIRFDTVDEEFRNVALEEIELWKSG